MFNKKFIIFSVIILCNITFNFAQVSVFLDEQSKPILSKEKVISGCTLYQSLRFSSNKLLSSSEILISGNVTTAAEIKEIYVYSTNLTHQVFGYTVGITEDIAHLSVQIKNDSNGFDEEIALNPIYCSKIELYNFKLTKLYQPSKVTYNVNTYFYMELNFTKESGYKTFSCGSMLSDVLCQCEIVTPPNFFICYLFLMQSGSPQSEFINLKLRLFYGNYEIEFGFENPFPWNVSRTSNLTVLNSYPPENYELQEDYRYQRKYYTTLGYTIFVVQDFTIEKLNSIVFANNIYLTAKNSTHHRFVSVSASASNTISSTISLRDSYFNTIESYSSSLKLLASVPTSIPIGNSIKINDQIFYKVEYLAPYLFNYTISFTMNKNILFKLNSPSYLVSNSSSLPKYVVVIPVSKYYNQVLSFSSSINSNDNTHPFVGINSTESYFRINSIDSQPTSSFTSILTVSVSSNFPIINDIFINPVSDRSSPYSLISGDEYNGIYQAEIISSNTPIDTIFLTNVKGDKKIYTSGYSYNDKFDMFPLQSVDESKIIGVSDLNYFKFKSIDVDLSNGPINNTVYFNFSKNIIDMIPYFSFSQQPDIRYYGAYDHQLKLYVINFLVPSWLIEGTFFYISEEFRYLNQIISGDYIQSIFNNDVSSSINIINPRAELVQPIITSILLQYITHDHAKWKISIYDIDNGFKYGVAHIVSLYDNLPELVYFNSANRTSGDQFNGTYDIRVNLPINCRGQNYTIDKIYLYDNAPTILSFDALNTIRGTSYEKELKYNCYSEDEYEVPVLTSISVPSFVQVGGYDRTIAIKFTTTDVGASGISKRHNPIIYLSSENGDIYQITGRLISNNGSDFNYIAKDQLPFGFGYRCIYVSIYGIVDNQNNYNSYTMLDLRNAGFSFNISRQYNPYIPFIERSSILLRGGSLTIYGRSMGLPKSLVKAMINYQDGHGYISTIPSFKSSVNIQFNRIRDFTSDFITIQLEVDGIKSNEFNIYPITLYGQSLNPTVTPSSTPSPSLCPGTPPCNNRGTCNPNLGCQCALPWYGPSCSDQIIPIEKPIPQPEPTIGTNITNNNNNNNNVTSMIKVLEIREIDSNDNIIQRYSIGNWNFTDLTSISANPTYQYTSILNQTSTSIKTTINFFENKTDINFGNEILTMQPSSIKFTIELSKYEFQSQTNFLQIVMESIIKGNNRDSCSSEQFGSDNNNKNDIKWMKIDIDKTSLYGRFIDFGMIDDRVTRINNKILSDSDNKQSNTERSMKIGITIPKYDVSAIIDPDFSNLITTDDENSNQLCKSSNKKLSTGAIIGIVVGCIGLVLLITTIIVLKKKFKYKIKMMIEMQER